MFLPHHPHVFKPQRFPRVRGDVPLPGACPRSSRLFSPRARGCSAIRDLITAAQTVFPACAGMFPFLRTATRQHISFPRVRGDVPCSCFRHRTEDQFSPRARGCSLMDATLRAINVVFPACAGMFRKRKANTVTAACFPRVRGDVPRW